MINKFSPNTVENIGYYVYVYSDPDTHEPFYVGKGQGNRVFDHLKEETKSSKVKKLKKLKKNGKEPLIQVLVHGLKDSDTAEKIEAAVIDLLGVDNLTNQKRGKESRKYGIEEVSVLDDKYRNETLEEEDITDNVILLKIKQFYREGMSARELYDVTRGYWRVGIKNRERVDFAFAVYNGIVREVYKVEYWLPALSTFTERSDVRTCKPKKTKTVKYEFVGRIADEEIRMKYRGKSVKDLMPNRVVVKYVWGKE